MRCMLPQNADACLASQRFTVGAPCARPPAQDRRYLPPIRCREQFAEVAARYFRKLGVAVEVLAAHVKPAKHTKDTGCRAAARALTAH